MFDSPACWQNKKGAKKSFEKLTSRSARLEAVKEQIRIRVIGFGWKDLHHPWSEGGVEFSSDHLLNHLCNKIIPEQKLRGIPDKPTMELPSRKQLPQLGTRSTDLQDLDSRYEDEKCLAIEGAIKMRETLEADGIVDRHEHMQPPRLEVGENMIGLEVEQLWIFEEEDGSKVSQWCQGLVVAVKTRGKVHI
jgi:hypothetical protein